MSSDLTAPPVLSTRAEHIFEDPTAIPGPDDRPIRTNDELVEIYEIERTAREIKEGRWTTIALQFPDAMLRDAAWVVDALAAALSRIRASEDKTTAQDGQNLPSLATTERLYVLADTSYSACCVDEIAAEHVNAQVVVHYGRSCLSPTSRLPIIYVFTRNPLDLDAAVSAFESEIPDKEAKVLLMADVTYQHHVLPLSEKLRTAGYRSVLVTSIVHNPSGTIPNRRIIRAEDEVEIIDEPDLKDYALFHVSSPPSALLLALYSRFRLLHVLSTVSSSPTATNPTSSTAAILRRRFARVLALAAAGVVGILVNTLSVSNYLASIDLLKRRIAAAGKKSYTMVVGKLNPAKLANFAEVDGWVVVGCWESGLVEEDAGFLKPVVAPFEMEVALMPESERVWGLEWWGGIERLKELEDDMVKEAADDRDAEAEYADGGVEGDESAPPEFDLRTGKLVSHSRPMRVVINGHSKGETAGAGGGSQVDALVKRTAGELATVKGVVSPGAEFLRSQRTWQGLGSDFTEERSTVVEEGRSGVARGYTVGEDADRR